MSIRIHYDEVKYRFPGSRRAVKLIKKIIISENKISGDLSFILTSDKNLLNINREFLKHNYNTDVIAFDYGADNIINGEVYVSRDSVKRNSINYNVSFENEMLRVMVHGVLHLMGYRDKTEEEKRIMTDMEDKWLSEYFD